VTDDVQKLDTLYKCGVMDRPSGPKEEGEDVDESVGGRRRPLSGRRGGGSNRRALPEDGSG